MEKIKAEYKDNSGYYIVKLDTNKYYYGDGKTINSIGISANQFLRFNPYMEYVADKDIKPSEPVVEWITKEVGIDEQR